MRALRQIISSSILAAVTVLVTPTCSFAREPNLDDCNKLRREQISLANKGIQADLEKGPEWAKSNLPANRVTMVMRYLHVYEQVRFRCEYVFAAAEAQAQEREASKAARARALANIPPPPVRRPKVTFATTKAGTGNVVIPPLPTRRQP